METIHKKCSCGRTYTRSQWEALPVRPDWVFDWGEVHQMRDCACGSTLHIIIKQGTDEEEASFNQKYPATQST